MAKFRIDGKVYEAANADQAYAMHDAASAPPSLGKEALNTLAAFNQGLTMGGADEIAAAADAVFSDDTYATSMARQKRDREGFSRRHPWISGTATAAGAVLPVVASTLLGPEATAASGVRGAQLVRQGLYGGADAVAPAVTVAEGIKAGARAGALPGAVTGYLTSDPNNRLGGTVGGTASGTAFGGTLGGASVALPRAVNWVRGKVNAFDDYMMGGIPRTMRSDQGSVGSNPSRPPLPPEAPSLEPASRAEAVILQKLRDGNITPQQAQAQIAQARRLNVPLGLVDVGGTPVQKTARGIRTLGGEAGDTVDAALVNRGRTQGPRLVRAIEQGTGRTSFGNGDRISDMLLQEARDRSNPYYRQLASLPPARDATMVEDNFGQLFETPAVRDIAQNADRVRAQWARPGSPQPAPLYGPDGKLIRQPTFEDIDLVKQSIEEMLSPQYQRTARPAAPVDVSTRLPQNLARSTRDQLVQAADAAPEGGATYAAARNSYAGPAQAREMFDEGRNFSSPTVSAEDVSATLRGGTAAQRKWYQRGVATALRDSINSAKDLSVVPNRLRGFWGDNNARDKFAAAMNPRRLADTQERMLMENRAAQTANFVRGGSQTADKAVEAGDALAIDMPTVMAGPKGWLQKAAGAVLNRVSSAMNAGTRQEIAQRLVNFNQAQTMAFLDRLQALEAQGRLTSQNISAAAAAAATQRGTQ